uniref:C-type lectin domain-containing protein n=1 Tax=Meleagris gallopavo TaxID=9103 RepID=A0A803YH06_MELGA
MGPWAAWAAVRRGGWWPCMAQGVGTSSSSILPTQPSCDSVIFFFPLVFPIEMFCTRCPAGWQQFAKTCYYFSTEQKSWIEARAACSMLGAQLAIVNSELENKFLANHIMEIRAFWLGLSDMQKEGDWEWLDGQSLSISMEKEHRKKVLWHLKVQRGGKGFGRKVNPTTWGSTVRTVPPCPPAGFGMMPPAPAPRPGSVSAAADGTPGFKMGANRKPKREVKGGVLLSCSAWRRC